MVDMHGHFFIMDTFICTLLDINPCLLHEPL